jgi:hypothetical protein
MATVTASANVPAGDVANVTAAVLTLGESAPGVRFPAWCAQQGIDPATTTAAQKQTFVVACCAHTMRAYLRRTTKAYLDSLNSPAEPDIT